MASADFSQFVVTTVNETACETSPVYSYFRQPFGLQCRLPPYPYFQALYAVPVRQVRGLLTASFRFRLAADTLAVRLCASSLPTRTRDLHPLENAHTGQTNYQEGRHLDLPFHCANKNYTFSYKSYKHSPNRIFIKSAVPYRLYITS